jgi:hypothetical protein
MGMSQFSSPMFTPLDTPPVWRPIQACDMAGLYTVGLARQGMDREELSIAFRDIAGQWWTDAQRMTRLGFEPNWFGPAPCFPPWPEPRG